MKPFLTLLTLLVVLVGCSSTVTPPGAVTGRTFPQVRGNSLVQKPVTLPDDFRGRATVVLIGYVQKAQFDIDRWILGLLQAEVPVQIVEVPTIAGMMPQMVQEFIDNGMRSGIPKSDWASVVTVYEDADKIIEVFGNERPRSAYVVLLDKEGTIRWTSNLGYSAQQVMTLKDVVTNLP